MEVSLPPTIVLPKAVLQTETPDGTYLYAVLEDGTGRVFKRQADNTFELAYSVRVGVCSCPGFKHRGSCKHKDIFVRLEAVARERGLLAPPTDTGNPFLGLT